MKEQVALQSDLQEIDPEVQQFAAAIDRDYRRFAVAGEPSLQQIRATAERVRKPWIKGGPVMARITDHYLSLADRQLKLRLFEPTLATECPALIYLHGGGWTIFSLDTHDRLMREYAARTGFKVIGVEYSLAPESRFPDQLGEIESGFNWLQNHAMNLGIDLNRLAIGGDSAGANLALASCLELRDRHWTPPLRAMLLNYGAFDPSGSWATDSWAGKDTHLPLTINEMQGFWQNYLKDPSDQLNPLANLLLAGLSQLPPAFLAVAECDILLDENLAMAKRLNNQGVKTELVVYRGATHSFLEAVSISRLSDRALAEASAWLKDTVV